MNFLFAVDICCLSIRLHFGLVGWNQIYSLSRESSYGRPKEHQMLFARKREREREMLPVHMLTTNRYHRNQWTGALPHCARTVSIANKLPTAWPVICRSVEGTFEEQQHYPLPGKDRPPNGGRTVTQCQTENGWKNYKWISNHQKYQNGKTKFVACSFESYDRTPICASWSNLLEWFSLPIFRSSKKR